MFKISALTSQKTHYVSIAKTNLFTVVNEIIVVYSENHTRHINAFCEQNAELSEYYIRQYICIIIIMLDRINLLRSVFSRSQ
jgi:hypothetical protein